MTKKNKPAGFGRTPTSRPQSQKVRGSKRRRFHPVARGLPLSIPCWNCNAKAYPKPMATFAVWECDDCGAKRPIIWLEDGELYCPEGHCKKVE